MIDVKKLIEDYANTIRIRENGDHVFATPSFFHIENDESIALRFSETEDGKTVITDCGTTRDYLELMYINLKDYREKLEAIKQRFFIEEEDGAFVMTIPSSDIHRINVYIGYFIQAVSVIANIDL